MYSGRCGGCVYQGMDYTEQLSKKQKYVEKLLSCYGLVSPIIGMDCPWFYRQKVHRVMSRGRSGRTVSGMYREESHKVIPVKECLIEDEGCQKIIDTVADLCQSFRIRIYDEDTGYGLLRHVMVRRGYHTGEVMLILVAASPVFPSKNNFVKAVRKVHPEITTVILNINSRKTTMVMGDRNIVLYGPGFIYDTLGGLRFRLSPGSFFQVNPVQAEILFERAVSFAGLTGKEKVLDTYCGTGVIGLLAAGKAGSVTGAELSSDAVRDAARNARDNKITNISFVKEDAGEYMESLAAKGEKTDVVFMDPPRSGSSRVFLKSLCRMAPERIVYISCSPETLARDLAYLTSEGYKVKKITPVDMFAWTSHTETVCLLSNRKPDTKVRIDVDLEDYYRIKDAKKNQN